LHERFTAKSTIFNIQQIPHKNNADNYWMARIEWQVFVKQVPSESPGFKPEFK